MRSPYLTDLEVALGQRDAAFRQREALVKALQDIRFISEDPIGLTEREKIQKLCNAALASVEVQS